MNYQPAHETMDNSIVLPVYKVEFKGLTDMLKKISGILGLSFWELLMSLPHGMPGGIYLTGFWILHQDFWAHHGISISNHRQPLLHSLHTQEFPFYCPNSDTDFFDIITAVL